MTANVFKTTYSLVYENGNLKRTIAPGTLQTPQATKGMAAISIAATTAVATVSIGNVTTPGKAYFFNTEATTTGNTWRFAFASSTGGMPIQFSKLPPKEFAQVYYGSSTMSIVAKMAAGTATIDAIVFEG